MATYVDRLMRTWHLRPRRRLAARLGTRPTTDVSLRAGHLLHDPANVEPEVEDIDPWRNRT